MCACGQVEGAPPKLLFVARKQKACRGTNYHIFRAEDGVEVDKLNKNSNLYEGKLRYGGAQQARPCHSAVFSPRHSFMQRRPQGFPEFHVVRKACCARVRRASSTTIFGPISYGRSSSQIFECAAAACRNPLPEPR